MSPPPKPPPPPPPKRPTPLSTLTYLRTHHDAPPHSLQKKRKDLTKSALTKSALKTAKTHDSLQRTRLKSRELLAKAREEQSLKAESGGGGYPRLIPRDVGRRDRRDGGKGGRRWLGVCIGVLIFQAGLSGSLVLGTMLGNRVQSYGLMGDKLVFGLVLFLSLMLVGILWGVVLVIRDRMWGVGERDWLGIWEVRCSEKQLKLDGSLGIEGGDLEAGFELGVRGFVIRDGLIDGDGDGEKEMKVVRLCVSPSHPHHTGSPPQDPGLKTSNLISKANISPSSPGPSKNTPLSTFRSETVPPPPSSPHPTLSKNSTPNTRNTQPKTWIYPSNDDIPLQTLSSTGSLTSTRVLLPRPAERRQERRFSLELKDMDSSRERWGRMGMGKR